MMRCEVRARMRQEGMGRHERAHGPRLRGAGPFVHGEPDHAGMVSELGSAAMAELSACRKWYRGGS